MNIQPDAEQLISIARQIFREDIFLSIPSEQRYQALMIANAMGIAERSLNIKRDREPDKASTLIGGNLGRASTQKQLSKSIREGLFDTDEYRSQVYNQILQDTIARVIISNPKALHEYP